MNKETLEAPAYVTFKAPIYIWELSLNGMWEDGIVLRSQRSYPNFFIRFMWRWVLGIHTRRIK